MSHADSLTIGLKYYQWAKEEWGDVTKLTFYLEEIRGLATLDLLDFLDTLSHADKQKAIGGLIGKGHVHTLKMLGKTISPAESQHAKAFKNYRRITLPNGMKMIGLPGPRLAAAEKRYAELGPPSAAELKDSVITTVEKLFGSPKSKSTDLRIVFRMPVSNLTLETWCDFGSRVHLRYGHNLFENADEALLANVSICSWLGIFRETWWNLAARGDEASTAACVGVLCNSFFSLCQRLPDNPRRQRKPSR